MSSKCFLLSIFFSLFLQLFLSQFSTLKVSAQSQTVNYQFNFGQAQTLEQKIQVACEYFGCNSGQLIRVMDCESEGKNIPNKSGVHSGIFQYTRRTWADFTQKAGIPNADIWSTDAQIYTTAWAFSNGQSYHWTCAKK